MSRLITARTATEQQDRAPLQVPMPFGVVSLGAALQEIIPAYDDDFVIQQFWVANTTNGVARLTLDAGGIVAQELVVDPNTTVALDFAQRLLLHKTALRGSGAGLNIGGWGYRYTGVAR